MYGEEHCEEAWASTLHSKIAVSSSELNEKVGVESLMKVPGPGPERGVSEGGSVSAVKPLKVWKAGFAVRLYL